jgi:hypothetical protein
MLAVGMESYACRSILRIASPGPLAGRAYQVIDY